MKRHSAAIWQVPLDLYADPLQAISRYGNTLDEQLYVAQQIADDTGGIARSTAPANSLTQQSADKSDRWKLAAVAAYLQVHSGAGQSPAAINERIE